MSRSKWKGPYLELKTTQKKLVLKRNTEITPSLVGKLFWVHNGKRLVRVEVPSTKRVGCRVGEFVPTRVEFIFKKKKTK